jgi:hypothetical protein
MDPLLKRMTVLIPILCFVILLSTEGEVSGHAHVWIHGAVIVHLDEKGMAATISSAGVLAILGQEGLLKALSGRERARRLVQEGLAIFGSLLVIGLGTLLLSSVV